jgi:hypothetical protein
MSREIDRENKYTFRQALIINMVLLTDDVRKVKRRFMKYAHWFDHPSITNNCSEGPASMRHSLGYVTSIRTNRTEQHSKEK